MTEPLPSTQYDIARQLGEALTQIAELKRLIADIAAADEAGLLPSKAAIRIAVKTIEAMK